MGCSSTAQLSSSWNKGEVVIDGQANEWTSQLAAIKDMRVSVGVRNDEEFLYVCVTSPDERFGRQMLSLGLTVWFEPENGEKMGIHYPIGMMRQGVRSAFGSGEGEGPQDWDRMTEESLQELELLGSDKNDRHVLSTLQLPGLGVKVGGPRGAMVYELKVPLKKSDDYPYAVGAKTGSTVKLGIETGKLQAESRPEGGFGGMRDGGRRGGDRSPMGGMPGGGRPGRQRPEGAPLEPLEYWANVRLAVPSSGGE
jgi:hypothetical protein